MPSTVQHLTLENGLQVTLRHAPQLKRCAAAVRIMAGSHDAPPAYAGLAHFLEHLLFLGNERFPLDDGLMRYVQRHGGQVNASTRERTTDYFFDVPQSAFAGGLERLCDMLTHPAFDQQAQLREREVIHAEFIAWSRNAQAQAQFALLQHVNKQHPLSGFQAGNRYSLPVHSPDFQAALQGFHQRYYQAGQMILSLSGPQSLSELESLARHAASSIARGKRLNPAAPPRLIDEQLKPLVTGQQLDLLHTVEQQPEGLEQAVDYLGTWLTDGRPGGLLAALRKRGWSQSLECSLLYSFAGQGLLHTRLQLNEAAKSGSVQALLHDWLVFFRDAERSALDHEFARLQQCREQTATALDLACRDSAARPYQALSEQAQQALVCLLDSILQSHSASPTQAWQLPAAEPLFDAHLDDQPTCAAPTGLSIRTLLPSSRQYGAVYLRWQVAATVDERLGQVIVCGLQPLRERAARAGVALQWETFGQHWQLRCAGLPATTVVVLREALETLCCPPLSSWAAKPASEADSMPIRSLLRRLPAQLVGHHSSPSSTSPLNQSDLHAAWQQAKWQALATGFDDRSQAALNAVLDQVPGQPAVQPLQEPDTARGWQMRSPVASENALLLFFPVPDEACARLLAQHIQGPFYQRLRVELQLGYAVFSVFRQIQGRSGLLFGVQSPSASHGQIINNIHEFLASLPSSLRCSTEMRQALAEQMSEMAMSNTDVAEWAWQAHLAGRDVARLDELQAAILAVDDEHLQQCANDLLQAKPGWLCLANGPQIEPSPWLTG